MIEVLSYETVAPFLALGGFLGGLFGGSTKVTSSTRVDLDVTVNPNIAVDIDVDTGPIAAEIDELQGIIVEAQKQQTGLVAAAIGQQAQAVVALGNAFKGGVQTLALAGLAGAAAFLYLKRA